MCAEAEWRGCRTHRSPIQLVQSVLARCGMRLVRTSHHKTLRDFIAAERIDLVLDVGANEGQFGVALRQTGYAGRIISFEPLGEAYRALSAVAARLPPWRTLNIGLGAGETDATLNVAANTVFSSLMPLSAVADAYPETRPVRAERIRLSSLDAALRGESLGRCLLKLDTQGYEREALLGATDLLRHARGVVMELPIHHLYEGVWLFEEAIAFMRTRDFIVSNFIPVNFAGVDLFEVDCVFRRAA